VNPDNQPQRRGCVKCFEVEWHIRGCGGRDPRNVYPVLDTEREAESQQSEVPETLYLAKHLVTSVLADSFNVPAELRALCVEYRRVKTCVWQQNGPLVINTGCGKHFYGKFQTGGSMMPYCGFCGGRLEVK
jgi:hypothetical protein